MYLMIKGFAYFDQRIIGCLLYLMGSLCYFLDLEKFPGEMFAHS